MQKVVEAYFHLLKFAIVVCLALMVVLVFGNVVLRYGFNLGITVSEEVSRWLFVWMTFLGAIVALREHGHLGVDTLVKRLPLLGKKACLVVEPAPDALRHVAVPAGQLAADRDQPRRHRAGLGAFGRVVLRRRARLRRLRRAASSCTTCIGSCPAR